MKTSAATRCIAVVATANKIAAICYKMARYKQKFNPVELLAYEAKDKQVKTAFLERKLAELK